MDASVDTVPLDAGSTEGEFARVVESSSELEQGADALAALLEESHPVYRGRGAAAVVRMRGFLLGALARRGLEARHVLYALEELDNGRDAYLVAAAARALRSHPDRKPEFAPYLGKALFNIRFHDDLVVFDRYGGYAVDGEGSTALSELLETIAWLGVAGRSLTATLKELSTDAAFTSESEALARALSALDGDEVCTPEAGSPDCCGGGDFRTALRAVKLWSRGGPHEAVDVVFEDQDGERVAFDGCFRGAPSIVVFFYTRCENPEKCSLTVTKLGRVVRMLAERGLGARIRTAAISYDPSWDVPERLRGYARNRGLPCDANHRLLRAVEGDAELRARFGLGVNFVESLVNRHRVELFLLDAEGRIHTSFERLQWDELGVVERAIELLGSGADGTPPTASSPGQGATERAGTVDSAAGRLRRMAQTLPVPLLAVATAFFPKCPACWAAYLSAFGIVGLDALPYSPWLLPLFALLMVLNLVSVGRRSAASGNSLAFWLSAAGAATILVFGLVLELRWAASLGVGLSLLGSLASALRSRRHSGAQNDPSTPRLGTVTGPIASSSQVP